MDLSKNFQALLDEVSRIKALSGVPKAVEALKPMEEGFSRGAVADTLGGPVDLINTLLSAVGLDSKEPVGGSKQIRGLLGMPKEEKQGPEAAGAAAGSFVNPANILAAGMMIGPKAANFSSRLAARMLDMKRNGATEAEAYKNTGSLVGPDGYLRQEISDKASGFTGSVQGKSGDIDLRWLYNHPELFDNYPELKDILVKLDPSTRNGSHTIGVNKEVIRLGTQGPEGESRSVLLHEIQHAIQAREGWARGGSAGMQELKPYLPGIKQEGESLLDNVMGKADQLNAKLANGQTVQDLEYEIASVNAQHKHALNLVRNPEFESYLRLMGEAEARNTQTRSNSTLDQLRNSFPLDTYDRPIDKLIKLFYND